MGMRDGGRNCGVLGTAGAWLVLLRTKIFHCPGTLMAHGVMCVSYISSATA